MRRGRVAIRRPVTETDRAPVLAEDASSTEELAVPARAEQEPAPSASVAQGAGARFNLGEIAILPPEPTFDRGGGALGAGLSARIRDQQGGGTALEPGVRGPMERAFGHHFGAVRVHADAEADALSGRLNAAAFTAGCDIFFRQGAYRPDAGGSQRLLAHELTHVIQQRGGAPVGPLTVRPSGDAFEREADAAGAAVAGALHAAIPAAPVVAVRGGLDLPAGILQRADDDASQGDQPAPAADDGQYEELQEDFQPDEGDETEQDLVAQYVPDDTPDAGGGSGGGQPNTAVTAPPVVRFIDGGRTGTARYGDPLGPEGGVFPHAFTDAGRTATTIWAGGGGAGAHGNEAVGSLQKHVPPVFFQTSKKADAFIRENTGQVDVRRSWTGINAGDQGNGHFVTAAAAARINLHETLHITNTSGHYSADIDPLLQRVANRTMDVVIAQALLPSATQRTLAALKTEINWGPSVKHFQDGDKADNKPMGAVDTADLASGTYPIDVGPGTVGGKAFQHRVRTPAEPNPAP